MNSQQSSGHTYSQQFEMPVSEVPERVVSLVPSVTESLFELNLGKKVIGRTEYCVYPEAEVTSVPAYGGTKNPKIQEIISLKPDLVIVNQEENRKEDVEALQTAGIPVWITFPKTIPEAFELLWNITYLFDETSMVPRLQLIERTYDWVWGITQERDDKGLPLSRVFAPIWMNPWMTINADTFVNDVIRACGGINVFAEQNERYPKVTLDDVLEAQPDVVLLPSEPFAFTQEHRSIFLDLDIPAAKSGQIHNIDGSVLTWHGTRLARTFDVIPRLLIPVDD